MPTFRIAAIPGDGIGGEVLEAGLRVLDRVADVDVTTFPWGSDYYRETGRMLPGDALDTLQRFDAIYFGAVGSPTVPDHVSLWGLRLKICQGFDQWANVRPVTFYEGLGRDPALDWIVVRENSEGEYAGLGGRQLAARGPGNEVAIQTSLFTEKGCERIIRFAFELARTRARRHLTSVTKSNAQQYAMVLWDEVFDRVKADYDDVDDRPRAGRRDGRAVRAPAATRSTSSSPPTCTATSCPTSAARSPAASGSRRAPTSTPSAATRACSSPSTARRPTSPARGSPTRSARSAARRCCSTTSAAPSSAPGSAQAIAATIKDGIRTRDLGGTDTTAGVTEAVIARL